MGFESLIPIGANLIGSLFSSDAESSASGDAAAAQSAASQAGIEEQRRQFDAIQKLLQPYVQAGTGALTGQQDLIGLNGAGPQQTAINGLQSSPMFTALQQQGENRILANASATGGLRGGNTQGALAQFSPALLSQLINDQYSRLGGLTSIGQNAAAGVGNAGMQTGNNITNLLGQVGSAQAGAALGQGRATQGMVNGITGAIGQFAGMGGFGSAPQTVPVDFGGVQFGGSGGLDFGQMANFGGGF